MFYTLLLKNALNKHIAHRTYQKEPVNVNDREFFVRMLYKV